MKDMHYRPKNENKRPAALISIFCALACIFLTLASSGIGYSAIFHSLVLVFGAIAIFFAFRYYLSYRTYHLGQMGGRQALTVTDTQGRRITTVFYLYLDEVEQCATLSRADRKKLPSRAKTFIFSNTLCAKRLIVLDAHTELGEIRVVLGADENNGATFAASLEERVRLSKTKAENESEE